MTKLIRLVIADDHPLILRGLGDFLNGEKDIAVVATCLNGEQALAAIREFEPDVAVLDIAMPGRSGMQVLQEVQAQGLPTRILFLSAVVGSRELMTGMAEGAFGFMLKESDPEAFLSCLRAVAAGKKQMPLDLFDSARDREDRPGGPQLDQLLTDREWSVMACAALGLSNKEIARKMKITEGTAKIHLHNIYLKTGVNNRTALANLAFKYLDQES